MLETFYLCLLLIIPFIEIFRKKQNKFDFLTLFNIYFYILYPLPGFLLAFDFDNAVSELGLSISLYTNNIETALAIFIGYFVVLAGFYSKSAQRLGKKIVIKARTANYSIVLGYAIFLLLISCGSIHVYSAQYGGLLNTVANTTLIRNSVLDGGSLGFFKRFILFSVFGSYLLCSFVFVEKIKKWRLFLIILFSLSVTIAFLAVTMTGGRAYVINYFVAFYLFALIKFKKNSRLNMIIVIIMAVLFLAYGKPFFYSLTALPDGFEAVISRFSDTVNNSSEEDLNFYSFMQNFHYPVHSLDVAFTKNERLRWFSDFIYGFLSLIPDKFLGTTPQESVMHDNTQYILKNFASQIPTGFLALGIYSMSWPGLLIVCFTYGWIGRCLQSIFEKHIYEIFWMPFLYIVTAQMWMDFLGSDPETFLQVYFCYLTACFLLLPIASKVFFYNRQV